MTTVPGCRAHESIQDRDWSTLKGDPLWRDEDGETVVYDGSFGDEIVPIFVNEGVIMRRPGRDWCCRKGASPCLRLCRDHAWGERARGRGPRETPCYQK